MLYSLQHFFIEVDINNNEYIFYEQGLKKYKTWVIKVNKKVSKAFYLNKNDRTSD